MFRLNTSNTMDIVKRHHHHQMYDLLLNDSFRLCRPSTPYCQGIKHQDTRNISTKPRMGKRVFSTIKFMGLVQYNNSPPLSLSSKYPRYWTLEKTNLTYLFLLFNSQLLATFVRNRVFLFMNNSITDSFTQTNN